jgi:hypothetical protein
MVKLLEKFLCCFWFSWYMLLALPTIILLLLEAEYEYFKIMVSELFDSED